MWSTLKVLFAIFMERRRQITREGYDTKHDDEHVGGEIGAAGAAYALFNMRTRSALGLWPFAHGFKPKENPEHNMVRAGALIVAELERLARQ